jgi:hypothetical protein
MLDMLLPLHFYFFHSFYFIIFYFGYQAANIHSPSLRGSIIAARISVQSEPHSHTEYVKFEPSLYTKGIGIQ